MSYKIVRTVEKNKSQLCICPSGWESRGTLHWPKKKLENMMLDAYSIPESGWRAIPCSVKRCNLRSYDVAEAELNMMCYNTDTENEDPNVQTESFNNLAIQLVNLPPVAAEIELPTKSAVRSINEMQEQNKGETDTKLDHIIENQNIIINNQEKLLYHLAEIQVKLEKAISTPAAQPVTTLKKTLSDNLISSLEKVNSIDQLTRLERSLEDSDFKVDLKNKYKIVCSSGNGGNCAFMLLDVIFCRDFLATCSWSGASRGETPKNCFKSFKNTINLFFELVYECDRSFTLQDLDFFFKNVLKNANKRRHAQQSRISTQRKRTHNRTLVVENNVEIEYDESDGVEVQDNVIILNIDQPTPENTDSCQETEYLDLC